MMKHFLYLLILTSGTLFLSGCSLFRSSDSFERFFVWGLPDTDAGMRQAAECGVTDGTVSNLKQKILARKYGIRTFAVFTPAGKNMQVMSPAEEKRFAELNALGDLKFPARSASRQEKLDYLAARSRFLKDRNYHHGGEPVSKSEVLLTRIPCLADPENMEAAQQVLNRYCEQFDIDGIAFDFAGYTNFHGCCCPVCKKLYAEYRKEKGLADTPENRNRFSLEVLVRYNNTLVRFIRERRPDLQIASHLYPVFLPEPLYGKYLEFDLCGETAAWYFLWPDEKIAEYTEKIMAENSHGVPFIGYYDADKAAYASFDRKSPMRLEHELKLILENGGQSLMLCSPKDLLSKTEYRAVLRKYMKRAQQGKRKE